MNTDIRWEAIPFADLTLGSLYAILHLRSKVFHAEQECTALDPDYKDQDALHLCGMDGDRVVAYCRIFAHGIYRAEASIGRVAVDPEYRGRNLGRELMRRALEILRDELDEKVVVISAQLYLQRFYEELGFVRVSEVYLEEGIDHIRMRYEAKE